MPVTLCTVRNSSFLPRHSQDNDAGCFKLTGFVHGVNLAARPATDSTSISHPYWWLTFVDCAIYAFPLAGSCYACRSARSCLQLLEVKPGRAWLTCGGQCAVTRDRGLLTLLSQGIHTGLVLCPFIGLGGHLGQPINLSSLSPLLFLAFHIVTGSNTSVPVLRLFLRVDDYPLVHPHYWTWTWFRLGCMSSGTRPFFMHTVSTPVNKTLPSFRPSMRCLLSNTLTHILLLTDHVYFFGWRYMPCRIHQHMFCVLTKILVLIYSKHFCIEPPIY